MNIFFTSDNHFNHKNILKYCSGRGERWSDVDEMNEGMLELWNATVKPMDRVYMLGDVGFWHDPNVAAKWLSHLNGHKFLVLGNHDNLIRKHKKYFESGPHLHHAPFVSISDYLEIKITDDNLKLAGHKICLFHYSCRVWNKAHYGSWLLWGHSHGELEPYGKSVDVGVDSPWVTGKAEYRPLSIEEVYAFMEKQELVGHHKIDL